MYFIIRHRDRLSDDPKVRKAESDAWDKAGGMSLKDAATERRRIIKRKRLEEAARRPDLVEKSIAESRAVRRNIEKRIND